MEIHRYQLQHSEKDQEENVLIVDLSLNDLGRVCEPGTVHVPSLMDVESYATIHTLMSTIRGNKIDNVSPVECVRATFLGGSMTGAGKDLVSFVEQQLGALDIPELIPLNAYFNFYNKGSVQNSDLGRLIMDIKENSDCKQESYTKVNTPLVK
jgi:hypothetical protein